ncbi:hypothetical protein J416_11987 [Gracilibacillus halophilus YIM-C55.5]|uniref:Uncharacterized protein n=1 Tax=Gracilibacillus halophilus YIM-C55.5 TaxID=1308866 RepID=N4W7H7_9BACI|nr:DUF6583 family protein [Gracilibacillus halophilus]ENH96223.1 hypothetical protein J416_11987 [Gracilibacillus halophilus YIM-C55.5]
MEDQVQNGGQQQRKKFGGWKVVILTIAVIAVVGVVTTFAFVLNKSPKEQYFLAEKNSFEQVMTEVEDRYQNELDWLAYTEEHAIESVIELSADMNEPAGMSTGMSAGMDVPQIVNNASLTITTAQDKQNKQAHTAIEAGVADIQLTGVEAYIDEEKAILGLPFIEDMWQVKGANIGTILNHLDPATFTGEEEIDFGMFFENSTLPEEDVNYIKEEYGKQLYDALPEDGFSTSSEDVDVEGETINAEKFEFHLTEEQLQTIFSDLFATMAEDERLKEIIKEQYQLQTFGGMSGTQSPAIAEEADQIIEEFQTAMQEASENVKQLSSPNGMTSTIWVNEDMIVKRDFQFEGGPHEDAVTSLAVEGTWLPKEDESVFQYQVLADEEAVLQVNGDLSFDGETANDVITITADQATMTLETNETIEEDGKTFERTLSFEDPTMASTTVIWSGEASYEADQMSSSHQLSVDAPQVNQGNVALNINKDASTIDQVEEPTGEQVIDLGSMSQEGFIQYMENDVIPQFQQWASQLLGPMY